MPKSFSELRAMMSPEARAETRSFADEDLKETPLHELRSRPSFETAITRATMDDEVRLLLEASTHVAPSCV